ncbi:MAG: hypothetical protein E5X86_29625 [Mesorhizobium sp.]|nr:MAG: hypothetical protein E5X86_29625 [Mesorhizobium sp.]TIP84176.1 MAG: hypothetical protein E5X63_18980 [Mesorhizobium sp.]
MVLNDRRFLHEDRTAVLLGLAVKARFLLHVQRGLEGFKCRARVSIAPASALTIWLFVNASLIRFAQMNKSTFLAGMWKS